MSARAVTRVTATIDPVTGVIVVTMSIRPDGQVGIGLYKAISDDLAAGDPTPTFTKTLGVDSAGTRTGDIDLVVSLATL